MGTSPTSKSAPLSNAAKDDVLGANGVFTFKISDLLANDAGGANKSGTAFFFGSGDDQNHQVEYMLAHGIVDNHDGTFTATKGDFEYSVQIGKHGTWSTADVDVAPHAGANYFTENFDNYTTASPFGVVDLSVGGWTNGGASELGENGYAGIPSTSNNYWLDTQNSPGPIDISHQFTDTTGGQTQLTFDIATQSLDYQGQHYQTDPNASFDFKVDGHVVAHITAAQINAAVGANTPMHFDIKFDDGAAGVHTLELVDHGASGFTGFAVDSIHINDWIV